MNGQFLTAQVIRACVLGLDTAPTPVQVGEYLAMLLKLAQELEKPVMTCNPNINPYDVSETAELKMHRADHKAVKEAGFASSGELLAAYKRLSESFERAQVLQVRKPKRWTDAEVTRLYNNSQDPATFSAFSRIVRLVEDAHDITES